jgi:hypothetical protein
MWVTSWRYELRKIVVAAPEMIAMGCGRSKRMTKAPYVMANGAKYQAKLSCRDDRYLFEKKDFGG